MISRFLKRMAPVAALALGTALAGCDGGDVEINGKKGVPLAELKQGGVPPPNWCCPRATR
jgi:hypothetical protein